MKTAKSIFWAAAIILFALGLWPLAILVATVGLTLSIVVNIQSRKHLQELETENQKLRQELEQTQVVQRVMNKTKDKSKEVEK